jgi:hypothetical protein
MNKLYLLLTLAVLASACDDKPEKNNPTPQPVMKYVDLHNREIKLDQEAIIDLDEDGRQDVAFLVYHIGDPIGQQEKIRFTILCSARLAFLVKDEGDQSYSPVKSTDDIIHTGNELPYEWWAISETFLAQKVMSETQPPYWEGNWRNANHKFFPYQFIRDGKKYCGWIEMSFDMQQEKLVLHRSATSTVADVDIKAGK